MQISLYLRDNHALQLDVDPDEFSVAIEQAVRQKKVVVVKESNGKTLSVNPQMVIYWKAAPRSRED